MEAVVLFSLSVGTALCRQWLTKYTPLSLEDFLKQLPQSLLLYPYQPHTFKCHYSVLISPSPFKARVWGPPFRCIQLLVQPLCSPLDQKRRDDSQCTTQQEQATSHTVKRFLASRIKVRAEPVADLADAVGNGNKRGLFGARRGDHSRLPGKLQVEAAVGARDEKYDANVPRRNVDCSNEDTAAGGGENNRDHDVPC